MTERKEVGSSKPYDLLKRNRFSGRSKALVFQDGRGLKGLMSDYLALGDMLEEIPGLEESGEYAVVQSPQDIASETRIKAAVANNVLPLTKKKVTAA